MSAFRFLQNRPELKTESESPNCTEKNLYKFKDGAKSMLQQTCLLS